MIRRETVTFCRGTPQDAEQTAQTGKEVLTRAERAYYRLSWKERLARNDLPSDAPALMVTLHGLPPTFAASFGFVLQATA